jgi:hypothetical protein
VNSTAAPWNFVPSRYCGSSDFGDVTCMPQAMPVGDDRSLSASAARRMTAVNVLAFEATSPETMSSAVDGPIVSPVGSVMRLHTGLGLAGAAVAAPAATSAGSRARTRTGRTRMGGGSLDGTGVPRRFDARPPHSCLGAQAR